MTPTFIFRRIIDVILLGIIYIYWPTIKEIPNDTLKMILDNWIISFPLIGTWIVYKFNFWKVGIEDGPHLHGKYRTIDSARYETMKDIAKDESLYGRIEKRENEWDEEGHYWAIHVINAVCRTIFVPVKSWDEE